MSEPLTPSRGIRLACGAPIPPAPSLGTHRPVTAGGIPLGATGALYGHWSTTHAREAAA